MSRRRARWLVSAVLLGIAAGAACTLNPQPLPPGEEEPPRNASSSGGGSSSGGQDPAASLDGADGGDADAGGDR
jgi:hypothetical protein